MTDKRILLLFFILVLLNGLDVLTTLIGFQIGAVESNPTSQSLMASLGVTGAMILKFFLILCLGLSGLGAYEYACHYEKKCVPLTRKVLTVVFLVAIIFYVYVVSNNIVTIFVQQALSNRTIYQKA